MSNALYSTIIICLKFKERVTNSLANLIYDDSRVVHELALLVSNITRDVCDVFESFLSFQGIYEEKKIHNMLSVMLDLRVKTFFNIIFYWA
jgi:hypothetical protein